MNPLASSLLLAAAILSANGLDHHLEDHHAPKQYKFAYGVKDPHTGDHHEQEEVNDGHFVKGSYSLKEADGTTRVVHYIAGPHSGFNAIVTRLGHAKHPQGYWKKQQGYDGRYGYASAGDHGWGKVYPLTFKGVDIPIEDFNGRLGHGDEGYGFVSDGELDGRWGGHVPGQPWW